jgi:4-hydroxy-tetrahydrodipicolinate synthase
MTVGHTGTPHVFDGRAQPPEAIPVWAMLATPFGSTGDIDHASLRRYAKEVIRRGCAAVVVLGVIGEPGALTPGERMAVVETAVASGVEVYVGVLAATHAERLAEVSSISAQFGDHVAGYLVPVTTPDPTELRDEITELSAAGARAILLQDYPASSGTHIEVDDLARAVSGLPWVAGIKCEAAPTFARIRRLRELVPSIALMSGLGGLGLVEDLSQGARLVAAGTSRPEVVVAAVRAWREGDDARARRIVGASASMAGFEIQQGTSIAIRKEHWRRQGVIASSAVRPPAMPYEPYLSPLSEAHGFPDPALLKD